MVETVVGRISLPESFVQVRLRCARACDPEHGIHEQLIVMGRSSRVAGFARQKRLDDYPSLIRNFAAAHLKLLREPIGAAILPATQLLKADVDTT